jgi:hypothetical protein
MNVEAFVPSLDVAQVAAQAQSASGVRALYAGVGLVSLGLVWQCLVQMYKLVRDERADFVAPVLRYAAVMALLLNYQTFVTTVVHLIFSLSQTDDGQGVYAIYAQRSAAFAAWRQSHSHWRVLAQAEAYALAGLAGLLYVLVEALVVVLRAIQTFTLVVITTYGPILIGFASLDAFFLPLAVAWFWALVEVSAWSVTMSILIRTHALVGQNIPEEFSVTQEMIYALTMLGLVITVPVITSSLVRGAPAAGMAAGIYSAMRTTQSMTTRLVTNKFTQKVAKGALSYGASKLRGPSSEAQTWRQAEQETRHAPQADLAGKAPPSQGLS